MFSGLAKELRNNGIDCETAHKLILGTEDTRIKISDAKIFDFLRKANGTITLITADNDLSEYCQTSNIPCIRIQDLVIDFIKKADKL
jgi:uncharacterized protein YacL